MFALLPERGTCVLDVDQSAVRNCILRAMPRDAFTMVARHLEPVRLEARKTLLECYAPIHQVLFPESGLIGVTTDRPAQVGIALIGYEGAVGLSAVLLGGGTSSHRCVVQAAGHGFAIASDQIAPLAEDVPAIGRLLRRYVHALAVQIEQTACVNATCDVEARVARWLLMSDDRMPGETIALTHDRLSRILAVQRTSVTLALHRLEGKGLIRAHRSRIQVSDRRAMLERVGDAYGVAEAEHARAIQPPPSETHRARGHEPAFSVNDRALSF